MSEKPHSMVTKNLQNLMSLYNQNKVLSEKTQELIDSGAVNQWMKNPIYYFVKGLRKVALEIDESGNFYISNQYPAYTESDQEFIKELLK